MSRSAVAVYDLSGKAGWAVYAPGLPAPESGMVRLPPANSEGSSGAAFHLLFDHICWIDKRWPLRTLGYEQFLAPTGGKKDDDTSFTTSPAAIKRLVGMIAVVEMCGSMLGIPTPSIHNMSWKKYWLGSHRRGTDRKAFKAMSVEKAKALGWPVKGDDEADAIGQLHFQLARMEIKPDWSRVAPPRELIMLGMQKGIPVHV